MNTPLLICIFSHYVVTGPLATLYFLIMTTVILIALKLVLYWYNTIPSTIERLRTFIIGSEDLLKINAPSLEVPSLPYRA